jgi:hypothetical protein
MIEGSAGLVERFNASFPSLKDGFNSRAPLTRPRQRRGLVNSRLIIDNYSKSRNAKGPVTRAFGISERSPLTYFFSWSCSANIFAAASMSIPVFGRCTHPNRSTIGFRDSNVSAEQNTMGVATFFPSLRAS